MIVNDLLKIMWKRANVKIVSSKYDCQEYTVEILLDMKDILKEEIKEIDVLKNDLEDAYIWICLVD